MHFRWYDVCWINEYVHILQTGATVDIGMHGGDDNPYRSILADAQIWRICKVEEIPSAKQMINEILRCSGATMEERRWRATFTWVTEDEQYRLKRNGTADRQWQIRHHLATDWSYLPFTAVVGASFPTRVAAITAAKATPFV